MLSSGSDSGVVVISSDDEEDTHIFQPLSSSSSAAVASSSAAAAPQFPPLPNGYVLPPLRGLGEGDRGRPERISTLREVLSTRNSRHRPLVLISRSHVHTGNEPVVPGVYNPIRSRALLPHERLRRREDNNRAASGQQSAPLPSTTAGRLLSDGTISVDDVDDSGYAEATRAGHHHQGAGNGTGAGRRRGRDETDNDDSEDDDGDEDDDEEGEMYSTTSDEGSAASGSIGARGQRWRHPFPGGSPFVHRGPVDLGQMALLGRQLRYTGAHEQALFLPLHPGILSHHHHHHMQYQRRRGQRRHRGSGGINHLDFFPGEDLGDLLSFLEANAPPPPPSRPLSPARPLKLTKHQEGLAANPDYSRKVPEANFRDSAETQTSKSLEIVCTQCTSSLFDKEHIWATPCGHVICNSCVEIFASASKTCKACKKRVQKKSLVHLFT
ncbi:hypothetical protein GGH91_000886 [Coemansia sp. RSA 2671]|nr:hypothetical protein GGH91_000886 [Coemansia sp. RSA 2671]